MHPVHSWKCSQTTEGLSPAAAALANWMAADAGSPTAAAATEQTFMKSRRSTPPSSEAW